MTYEWKRWDVDEGGHATVEAEGEFVLAEDAINREAVNADKIRTLEVQLKEAKLRANRLDRLLSQKNQCIIEARNSLNKTFDLE